MSTVITTAGEQLIAQKIGAGTVLSIDTIILAHIPDLDLDSPVDREQGKPQPENVVHEYAMPEDFKGYVNPNQVVYSMLLGSEIGNFQFNWLGLYSSADDVLIAVTHLPVTQKWQTDNASNTLGNNLTRNFMLEFSGAKAVTNITVEAKTWQVDFTARLRSIDERERRSSRDIYGRSCFFNDGFSVVKAGSSYVLKAGAGYVEGIRCVQSEDTALVVSTLPTCVFLDVSLQQRGSDVVPVVTPLVAGGASDYVGANNVSHYCIKLAGIDAGGVVWDDRRVEAVATDLVEYLKGRTDSHAQDKEDPHSTMTKVTAAISIAISAVTKLITDHIGNKEAHSVGIYGGCIWFDGAVNADGRPIDAKTGEPDLNYGVCDGRTYTAPDGRLVTTINARNRFIVTAGDEYDVGVSGGSKFVTPSIANMPVHSHFTKYSNSVGSDGTCRYSGGSQYNGGVAIKTYVSSSTGGSQPQENRPPYIGLCLIKRL